MEEIDILDFIKYYLSKIYIVGILLFVILIYGNIYVNKFKTPLYQSSTTVILVSEKGEKDTDYTQSDINLNKNLVTTYSHIIKSKKVLNEVIKNLNLDYNYSKLNGEVSVSNITNTEIIKITVSDSDPTLAMKIADSIVPVFTSEVKRIYGIENVSVVDTAEESSKPYNIKLLKSNLLFILISIALGSIIIFIIYYFDTSVKSAEMIEEKLGLTVLGTIPKIERRD